ncbi:YtnP family quorum-quenching lactonase [Bacillus sp. 2205SS5-2]|uniref:YtnP family quorum-quenching lactonase n=1 Tax=Bacillus sp. 2205SS5-2 TaxID=3109031 RepID=UPI003003B8D1
MEQLTLGDITFTWLNGGVTHMDGGAMFGVVPKPLWSKRYDCNEKNQIELRTDPIFFQYMGKNIMIESGIGVNRLTEKQKRNYGVEEESSVEASLAKLEIKPEEIDIILMTHMHFDHASGLSKQENGELFSAFPTAKIYTSETEWTEMQSPNIRSQNTYWKDNWTAIQHQVSSFQNEIEILPGLKMIETGGHSDGHSIITIEYEEHRLIHMADIMPTHAHLNPLWVLAYDDYPMKSIQAKEKWISKAKAENYWFLFYHDAQYRALRLNEQGEALAEVKRGK